MEPFGAAVAHRVMTGSPVRNARAVECLAEPRGSELRPVVGGQRYTGGTASSVLQRCERFQPTISRTKQSITHGG